MKMKTVPVRIRTEIATAWTSERNCLYSTVVSERGGEKVESSAIVLFQRGGCRIGFDSHAKAEAFHQRNDGGIALAVFDGVAGERLEELAIAGKEGVLRLGD